MGLRHAPRARGQSSLTRATSAVLRCLGLCRTPDLIRPPFAPAAVCCAKLSLAKLSLAKLYLAKLYLAKLYLLATHGIMAARPAHLAHALFRYGAAARTSRGGRGGARGGGGGPARFGRLALFARRASGRARALSCDRSYVCSARPRAGMLLACVRCKSPQPQHPAKPQGAPETTPPPTAIPRRRAAAQGAPAGEPPPPAAPRRRARAALTSASAAACARGGACLRGPRRRSVR